MYNHIPNQRHLQYNLRAHREYPNPNKRTSRYENSFFPFCISEWEKLDEEIKNLASLSQFKHNNLLFIRSIQRSVFGTKDTAGLKLLTKLRAEFSDLRAHRFHHNFNCNDPKCSCSLEEETNSHFLLRCPHYIQIRQVLLGNLTTLIRSDISVFPHNHLADILLYGSNVYNNVTNRLILHETISYLRKSQRFENIEAFST